MLDFFSEMQQLNLLDEARRDALDAKSDITRQAERIHKLERGIGRLALISQALWELVRDRTGISEAELADKIQEVDLRDGTLDGAFTARVSKCPKCARVVNSKRSRCIYCGEELTNQHVFNKS
jgi:hypothetical protein